MAEWPHQHSQHGGCKTAAFPTHTFLRRLLLDLVLREQGEDGAVVGRQRLQHHANVPVRRLRPTAHLQ